MLDKDTLNELSKCHAVQSAEQAVHAALGVLAHGVVALPNDYTVHDMESHLARRRRARGTMTTQALDDFATYVAKHREEGACVFVDAVSMSACAVLNLGTPAKPGQADNRAIYKPPTTAAYDALRKIANGQTLKQQQVAEFLEDWYLAASIECKGADEAAISIGKAISAVRQITLEGAKKVESTEQQLSAQRSSFESITASSTHGLPGSFTYTCRPHLGMEERTFVVRLGVITGDKPMITLRVAMLEQHVEDMAAELAESVREASLEGVDVVVGSYERRA